VDYGYENEVLLPVTIDVPSDLASGADVALSAHASWLVCSDTCIPEDAEVRISESGARSELVRTFRIEPGASAFA
jgi:thiol:disulfide interchange protein DsbD